MELVLKTGMVLGDEIRFIVQEKKRKRNYILFIHHLSPNSNSMIFFWPTGKWAMLRYEKKKMKKTKLNLTIYK